MDAKQFDELVARLAGGPNRRDALKGMVGGALAAVGLSTEALAKGKQNGKGKGAGAEHKGKGGKGRGKGAGAEGKGKKGKDGAVGADGRKRRPRNPPCMPQGRLCGCRPPKGGKRRRRHCRPCNNCCFGGYSIVDQNGDRRCSCRPTSEKCDNDSQCCSGICDTATGFCKDYGTP